MEIILQGHSTYGIKDWNGTVEVSKIKYFGLKRIAGSRNAQTIMRKFLKILKGNHSPVILPDNFPIDKMDLIDFYTLLIASTALAGGRQEQRTFTCPHCKALNPRVLDILQIFRPKLPEIPGGSEIIGWKVAKVPANVTCHNITVGNFLRVYEMVGDMKIADAKTAYGDLADFEDEEDLEDFKGSFDDVALIALTVDIPGVTEFADKFRYLLDLQEKNMDVYIKISEMVMRLSPSMDTEYNTKCTNAKCNKEIKIEMEPTDYFLA